MSQWTHVSGCIRIDGLPNILGLHTAAHDYATVLGRPSSDPDGAERYDSGANIPGGSEGTIQYEASDTGDGLVWKTVAVWGDLRDFGTEDTNEIDDWFARIAASPLMLRAAHLLIEVESGPRYLLVAEDKVVRRVELSSEIATA